MFRATRSRARLRRAVAGVGGFAAWTVLALALAGIGTLDALTRLLTDHNSFSDSGYVVMAAAWLTLAGWAATKGFDSLPARGPGIRRGWFVGALLLSALPYSAVAESNLGYLLNGLLISVSALFAVLRRTGRRPLWLLQPVVDPSGLTAARPATGRGSEEWTERKRFFEKAAQLTPYVAVESDEQRFFIRTEDKALGSGLFAKRARADMSHLAAAVRLLAAAGLPCEGSTFVDVGANIGTTTVAAMTRHGFARAVALEPAPANAHTLRLNLFENDLGPAVQLLEVAASDESGELSLVLSTSSSGRHSLAPAVPRHAGQTVGVAVVTLDELVEDGTIDPTEVGLLWIDTPKHEARVLAGASALLRAGVPVVSAVRGLSGVREAFLELFAGYTDFADLRADGSFRSDLGDLLPPLRRPPTDVLAIRRPASHARS